ncbi:MAG: HAMP domain-containing sensor histidine kinase [Lachnospiraceae bacterium]|nr:HAMP domain-containing sensor histidine kinase [Lachnospiraceae bacterium]
MKKKFRFTKSLRFRIMVILILIGIIPSIIMTFGIVRSYEERAVSLRAVNVRNQCEIICNQLVQEDYLNQPTSESLNSQLTQVANIYSGRILIMNSDSVIIKDVYDLDTGRISVSKEVISCFKGTSVTQYDDNNRYIEMTIPIRDEAKENIIGVMLVSVSTNEIAASVSALEQKAVLLLMIIAVMVLAFSYLLSDVLVRPFARVTRAIEDLTDGFLDGNISVTDYTETELITDAFNKMLTRVKTLDDSRQEFVSNVSHELKTPLTSMKVLADSLVGQENVPIELYQEFMQDITDEIDRENKIITDLLELVKMDKKSVEMNVHPVNINEWLESVLKRLKPIAGKRNIELILDSFRPVQAEIDEVKLTLAISNLIENGIKYNVEDGWVRVSLDADHKYFYITIADSGIGIPEESIDQIFERFYRVDKSHSTEIEGNGLGLAITKNAIVMHRGAIKVRSKQGEGTAFSVRIPLTHRQEA